MCFSGLCAWAAELARRCRWIFADIERYLGCIEEFCGFVGWDGAKEYPPGYACDEGANVWPVEEQRHCIAVSTSRAGLALIARGFLVGSIFKSFVVGVATFVDGGECMIRVIWGAVRDGDKTQFRD